VSLVMLGAYLLPMPNIGFLEQRVFGIQMNARAATAGHAEAIAQSHRKIVLVPITEETLRDESIKKLTPTLPLPRACHAKVLRELHNAGAKVVVFDLLFDAERPGDSELAATARACKNVVWAALWDSARSELQRPNQRLLSAVPYIGHPRTPHTEVNPTSDRIEAVISTPQGEVPALSVQALRLYRNAKTVKSDKKSVNIGDLSVPLAPDGTFKIAFSGQASGSFDRMSYEVVYEGLQGLPIAEKFKDSIVIIGDVTEGSKDYSFTPLGRMAGMEIHAHALSTLLQGTFITEAGPIYDLLTVALLAALAWSIAALLPLRHVLPIALLLLVGFLVFNTWLCVDQSVDLALIVPLGIALLMTLGVVAERGWLEEGQRRRMGTVLTQYVSPQLAQEGVPSGEMTLVFTDIEGSSPLSERYGAAFEVVRETHINLLREAARQRNGFEVETAGDSLFLVFKSAADAVRFAVEAQLSLARHQWPQWVAEESKMPGALKGALPVRMGMHTGTPFVRRDRNRLVFRGPVTNRAFRVMSAGGGGQILLSNATWQKAQPDIALDEKFAGLHAIERGSFRLKGIGEDRLWEVFHPDLFDPPPRPLRDEAVETISEAAPLLQSMTSNEKSNIMPQADSPSGATKETPTTADSDQFEEVEKRLPQQDDIKGGGALDNFSNREPGEITGGDTDKFGIKPPDAMGAGA
jgi:CHASE2 domain-containing sensor protein/class 3 adenylate cyclase